VITHEVGDAEQALRVDGRRQVNDACGGQIRALRLVGQDHPAGGASQIAYPRGLGQATDAHDLKVDRIGAAGPCDVKRVGFGLERLVYHQRLTKQRAQLD